MKKKEQSVGTYIKVLQTCSIRVTVVVGNGTAVHVNVMLVKEDVSLTWRQHAQTSPAWTT
jgi:hypothetical protein